MACVASVLEAVTILHLIVRKLLRSVFLLETGGFLPDKLSDTTRNTKLHNLHILETVSNIYPHIKM